MLATSDVSARIPLFESSGSASGDHTQIDLSGLQTVNGIADVEGNYPSRGGVGERAAWFRDSEGNLLGLGQPMTS